jgi:glycosyltransferase involved in cell wall biosynthesis
MTVSVAMCTYNGAPYVREQLDSVARQSHLPDELIVNDDASSDGTVKIIEAWARDAPFPVALHVNDRNVGLFANFCLAIERCHGDIIALADQDDVWQPNKLALQGAVLSAQSAAGLVFSHAEVVNPTLQPLGYTISQSTRFGRREQSMMHRGRAFDVLMRRNVVTGATMAFRSHFRDLILPIPENQVHLHDAWIALLVAAVSDIAFIPESFMSYRQHAVQQTGAHAPVSPRSLYQAVRTHSRARIKRECQATIEWLSAVETRLLLCQDRYPFHASVISKIRSKQRLARTRLELPDNLVRRVPLVGRESLALNYHRYSRGKWDLGRDLVP